MPIKHTEVMKMKHVKALKTTQVILLLVVITFLSGIPGMVFGEEAFSVVSLVLSSALVAMNTSV
jgi:hypothetical protein